MGQYDFFNEPSEELEFYYSDIINKRKEQQRENRMRAMRGITIGHKRKPLPLYLWEIKTDEDADTPKLWYRNAWRKGGFELIDECKAEEKRYNVKYRGYKWNQEFGNLSEEEITKKKNLWFSISWVESNTDWRNNPHKISRFETLIEERMHHHSSNIE